MAGAQPSPAQGPSSTADAPQTPGIAVTPGNTNPGGGGVAPLNPLALHRSFCPWVAAAGGGGTGPDARVGWRWCLDVLVPAAGPEEAEEGGAGGGAGGAAAFSRLDPAAKLRALLRKLGV